jgi:hypothetical protein
MIPRLADQVPNVDPPYYPEAALKAHKEGICEMHVWVSATGVVVAEMRHFVVVP